MNLTINDILSELYFINITSGIVMPVFITLGLIGNLVILIILCGKSMRSAPVCLLQALAVHDIFNMMYAVYADVYPAITTYRDANEFVESLEYLKRKKYVILSSGSVIQKISYYVLRLIKDKSIKSVSDLFTTTESYKSSECSYTYDYFDSIQFTTSANEITTKANFQSISITDKDRKEFIIRSIERFIGYNIVYSGLLFALCLTSERCFAVLFPMKVGNCLTIKRTRILIVVTVCICLVVHSPQLIKEIIVVYTNPNDLFNDEKGLILSFRSAYERFYVISSLILCILMLALNFVLLWKIRSHQKSIQMTKHTKRAERKELNVSLLIVVLVLFQLPHYIFVIVISFITKEIYHDDFTSITRASVMIRLFFIIQASLNFVIYCLFAKKFRDVMRLKYNKLFKKLLMKNCCQEKNSNLFPPIRRNMTTFLNFPDIKLDVNIKKSASI